LERAWRLDERPLVGGVVYKTHDLPEYLPRSARAKVLFTFRPASLVATSIASQRQLMGKKWFRLHVNHLRSQGEFEDFLVRDNLGLEAQIDKWSQAEGVDVLGVKYESLWRRQPEIEAFLGFPIDLPPQRRASDPVIDPKIVERLRQTYADLDRKIEAMPDVFIRRADPA
jgi:hypothetical protein